MLLPRDDQARDVASDSGPFGGPEFRPVSRPFVASQRWSGPVAMIARRRFVYQVSRPGQHAPDARIEKGIHFAV